MRRDDVFQLRDRTDLVQALVSISHVASQPVARRFLEGLSRDELGYIAEFFGATLLDPGLRPKADREVAARCVQRFQQATSSNPDSGASHKMILLLEFLSLLNRGPRGAAWAARSGTA